MWKTGEIVRCYDDEGQRYLTFGKHYTSMSETKISIGIKDDSGTYRLYHKERFIYNIKKIRKHKIKRLCL